MAESDQSAESDEQYRDCFVAFLDVLGFRALVARIAREPDLLRKLSRITAISARPGSGEKQTALGPCVMQTRAFSDSLVIFTPVQAMPGEFPHPNPLAQLLFVVRYMHDCVLELDACIRGGVALGPMYWHRSWSGSRIARDPIGPSGLPLTFGQGLVDAYKLEHEMARVPRVVISGPVIEEAQRRRLSADPFASMEEAKPLTDYFRVDRDAVAFLDLLHANVTRNTNETLVSTEEGFTILAQRSQSSHQRVIAKCRELVQRNLADPIDERVRAKYEWLQGYLAGGH